MKVIVKSILVTEIELPDDFDDHAVHFYVEENHCPGTGEVGNVIEVAIEKAFEERERSGGCSGCWACALQGKCEVIKIKRKRAA